MELETIGTRVRNLEKMILTTKEVLTFDEVATYTGLSKSYLYKLTSNGTIPHYKPNGKMCYFKHDEIVNWLLQNRASSNHELDTEASNYLCQKRIGKNQSRNKDEYEAAAESIVNYTCSPKKKKA
ncbi:MAG: helix-turn-helix domain-containing protein [Chitinophagaceae bacterium]|nr:helix-turn-helix domain-containing protein [Chitinophagaceae bacterium]